MKYAKVTKVYIAAEWFELHPDSPLTGEVDAASRMHYLATDSTIRLPAQRAYTPAERYAFLQEAASQVEQEEGTRRLFWSCLLGAAIVGAIGLATINFVVLAGALILVALAVVTILLFREA